MESIENTESVETPRKYVDASAIIQQISIEESMRQTTDVVG